MFEPAVHHLTDWSPTLFIIAAISLAITGAALCCGPTILYRASDSAVRIGLFLVLIVSAAVWTLLPSPFLRHIANDTTAAALAIIGCLAGAIAAVTTYTLTRGVTLGRPDMHVLTATLPGAIIFLTSAWAGLTDKLHRTASAVPTSAGALLLLTLLIVAGIIVATRRP